MIIAVHPARNLTLRYVFAKIDEKNKMSVISFEILNELNLETAGKSIERYSALNGPWLNQFDNFYNNTRFYASPAQRKAGHSILLTSPLTYSANPPKHQILNKGGIAMSHPENCECVTCRSEPIAHAAECGCAECIPKSITHAERCQCPECSPPAEGHSEGCACPECSPQDIAHADQCECPECQPANVTHADTCSCVECSTTSVPSSSMHLKEESRSGVMALVLEGKFDSVAAAEYGDQMIWVRLFYDDLKTA